MLLTKQQKQEFINEYPLKSTSELCKKYLVCEHKIRSLAKELGIYYNKTGHFQPEVYDIRRKTS